MLPRSSFFLFFSSFFFSCLVSLVSRIKGLRPSVLAMGVCPVCDGVILRRHGREGGEQVLQREDSLGVGGGVPRAGGHGVGVREERCRARAGPDGWLPVAAGEQGACPHETRDELGVPVSEWVHRTRLR